MSDSLLAFMVKPRVPQIQSKDTWLGIQQDGSFTLQMRAAKQLHLRQGEIGVCANVAAFLVASVLAFLDKQAPM